MRDNKSKTGALSTIAAIFVAAATLAHPLAYPTSAQAATPSEERQSYTLNDAEWEVLEQIRRQFQEVSCGQRAFATVEIDPSPLLGTKEWVADSDGLITTEDGEKTTLARYAKSRADYHIHRILVVLCRDDPSTTTWVRDPQFYRIDPVIEGREQNGQTLVSIAKMKVSCEVTPCFSTDKRYEVSAQGVQSIQDSISTAQAIADRHASEPVERRLRSYCDEIYALTTYAEEDSASTFDTDSRPWCFTSVFDGDPSTKTKCEGYSKALKLLVELSGATDYECHAVKGCCLHDGGSFEHMWCVVKMPDGKTYILDPTNNQSSPAFLLTAQGTPEDGYATMIGDVPAVYTYDEDDQLVRTRETLAISDTPYVGDDRTNDAYDAYADDTYANEPHEGTADLATKSEETHAEANSNELVSEEPEQPVDEQADEEREWDIPLVDNEGQIALTTIEDGGAEKAVPSSEWVVPATASLVAATTAATATATIVGANRRSRRQIANYRKTLQRANR